MGSRFSRIAALLTIAAFLLPGCAAPELTSVALPRHWPAAAALSAPVDPYVLFADERLAEMTLRQKLASLFMLHTPGTDAAGLAGFVDAYQPGGLILMGDNIPDSLDQLHHLVDAASTRRSLPIITGIDQEGGVVRRIHSDESAAAAQLKYLPAEATREAFTTRGALLESVGVSVNFGIVADETSDRSSFIFSRVLGTTPEEAAVRVAQAVLGESGQVLSTLKHFPGHGAAPGDSHFSIPSSAIGYDEWRASHAVPFAEGITAGAEFVMMGHLRFSAIDAEPASLSPRWHAILRDDLGFEGIIISDDMLMLQRSREPQYTNLSQNAVAALAAGTTMLLYVLPADPEQVGFNQAALLDELEAAVADGRLTLDAVDDAAHKLLVLRRQLSEFAAPYDRCADGCSQSLH